MENRWQKSNSLYQSSRIHIIQYSIALNNIKVPTYLFFILILVQAIQLISMSVIEPLKLQSFALNYFQYIAQIMFPEQYLRTSNLVLYVIPVNFGICLLHFGIVCCTFRTDSRLRFAVLYFFILFNTILLIPFLLCNVSILSCSKQNPYSSNFTCYQGYHIVYLLLACFNIVWLIFCTFFVFILCSKTDPLSTDYYSTSFNLWILVRFLLKISPIIFINVDPNLKFGVLYSVSFAGVNLVYFVAFKLMWPSHRNCQKTDNFVIRTEIIVIFVTAFLIPLHFFTDDPFNISFIFSWILGLIFSQILIQIFNFKKQRLISIYIKTNEQQQIKQQTYLKFFTTLLYQIQHTPLNQIQILHILKLHQLQCTALDCCCHVIQGMYAGKNQKGKEIGVEMVGGNRKEELFMFVNCLIKEASAKLKRNNVSLLIASAYVSYFKLNQKIVSVHNLSELLKSSKLSFSQEISIRRLFSDLKNTDKSLTDLNKYLEFSQNLWNFQRQAETAAQNCQKYWNYLIQQDCSTTKVWKLANVVQNDKQKLRKMVNQKLFSIFPNNLHTLQLYSQLLTLIYRIPSQKIKQYSDAFSLTSSQLGQSIEKEQQLIFRDNEDISVMCSAEFDGVFEFLRVSSNIIDILNVRNVDLIGKNVNTIMLEIYQEFHDKKLKQYFNVNDRVIRDRNSKVYLIGKEGKVLNCFYRAKVIASMEHGLELVCFLKKSVKSKKNKQKFYYLIYYLKKQGNGDDNYKNGDIIHIEPQLKNILFPPQPQKQNNENYVPKIEQVLPQWDMEEEQMISTEEFNFFNKITKIEVAHEDELDQGVVIKYLKIQVKKDKCEITIQQFQSSEVPLQKRKRPEIESKDVAYGQTSHSRLIICEDTQKIKKVEEAGLKKHPIPISKLLIGTIALGLIGLIVLLCVIPFKVTPTYLGVQMKQFQNIQIIHQLGAEIFEISLNIQKNLNPSLTENNQAPVIQSEVIDNINQKIKSIYGSLGIQRLNSQINVLLKIYQNNIIVQVINETLNNGVSYLVNAMSHLIQNFNDSNQKNNLYGNLQSVYQSSKKVAKISNDLMADSFRDINTREVICTGLELGIMVILFFATVLRSVEVSKLADSTIRVYQSVMDTFYLRDFVHTCGLFIDKIRGIPSTPEYDKVDHLKVIFTHVQKCNASAKNQTAQQPQKQNELKQQEQQEQQKLVDLRKKVSFHQSTSYLSYIFAGFLIISMWVAIKIALKFQTHFKKAESERIQNLTQIDSCFQLNSDIESLVFYLGRNQSSAEFQYSLKLVQEELTVITQYNSTKQSIKFQQLFKSLADLKSKKSQLNFTKTQQIFKQGQTELLEYAHQQIQKQYQATNSERSALYLAADVIVGVIAIAAFWKLMVIQEEIRIGCSLMLEMIKEGLGSQDGKEKVLRASALF